MPVSASDIKTQYPLPVYNFRVEIGSDAVAFSEVSGLSIGRETQTYKSSPVESGIPGPRIMHMPAQVSPVNLTLKRGVVPAISVKAFFAWINSIQINQVEKKDIFVRLMDETGKPVMSWKVINAFPTKLEGPSFNAGSNEVALETMQLMADNVMIEVS